MKLGAVDFITKPFNSDEFGVKIERLLRDRAERERLRKENVALRIENTYLKEEADFRDAQYAEMVGESPPMMRVFQWVERVARIDSTVMVYGESGTGKELVARAIHARSGRREGPFVRLNCGAIPETLLESELFGHEKGAFTGANRRHKGRFELANKGTLFLDEDFHRLADDSSSPPSRAAGEGARTGGRRGDDPRGRSHRRGHQRRGRRSPRQGRLPGGSLLPPSCVAGDPPPLAGPGLGHPAPGGALRTEASGSNPLPRGDRERSRPAPSLRTRLAGQCPRTGEYDRARPRHGRWARARGEGSSRARRGKSEGPRRGPGARIRGERWI